MKMLTILVGICVSVAVWLLFNEAVFACDKEAGGGGGVATGDTRQGGIQQIRDQTREINDMKTDLDWAATHGLRDAEGHGLLVGPEKLSPGQVDPATVRYDPYGVPYPADIEPSETQTPGQGDVGDTGDTGDTGDSGSYDSGGETPSDPVSGGSREKFSAE